MNSLLQLHRIYFRMFASILASAVLHLYYIKSLSCNTIKSSKKSYIPSLQIERTMQMIVYRMIYNEVEMLIHHGVPPATDKLRSHPP